MRRLGLHLCFSNVHHSYVYMRYARMLMCLARPMLILSKSRNPHPPRCALLRLRNRIRSPVLSGALDPNQISARMLSRPLLFLFDGTPLQKPTPRIKLITELMALMILDRHILIFYILYIIYIYIYYMTPARDPK